jgi:asparagine synthase (glutamine-hydrolysing)
MECAKIMKKIILNMNQDYGWKKFIYAEYIFWFKGYIIDNTSENIAKLLVEFLSDGIKKTDTLSDFLSQIRGHYSFVIHRNNMLVAVVDKVCSIPLFYKETSDTIIISNNAGIIKKHLCNNLDIDNSSILEISMSGYTLGRKTLYSSMYQIMAGEYMHIHDDSRIERRYYHTYSPWKVNTRTKSSLKNELTNVLLDVMDKVASTTKNKKIIVPLSAGYDSRLIVSGLKQVGVEDVLCISYGRENSFEVLAAHDIAKKLGYEFKHIHYDSDYIRNFYNSDEYSEFKKHFNRYNSVEFLQDMSAISFMTANSEIDKDSVIVNGMSGDYISGAHTLDIFSKIEPEFDVAITEYIHKHYNLWASLLNNNNKKAIADNILMFLRYRIPDFENFDKSNVYAIFEALEYYGRQSKFVIKGQEVYDYYGYDWRLPLWDSTFVDFWEGVPLNYKLSQKLYKDVLVENDWGGVWSTIPLNQKTIQPSWIRPIRLFFKVLFSPIGRKQWHQFERNALHYWMDDYGSKRYPYSRFLMDKKGHRNIVSFRSEDYLREHTDFNTNHFI